MSHNTKKDETHINHICLFWHKHIEALAQVHTNSQHALGLSTKFPHEGTGTRLPKHLTRILAHQSKQEEGPAVHKAGEMHDSSCLLQVALVAKNVHVILASILDGGVAQKERKVKCEVLDGMRNEADRITNTLV